MATSPDIFARLRDIREVMARRSDRDRMQFGTALYVIEDCECAIRTYETMAWPAEQLDSYLAIYGILQALYVQQDAVRHLHEAVALKYQRDGELRAIRHARNAAIGHPSRQGGEKTPPYHHSIVQVTMSRQGFDLMSLSEHDHQHQGINVLDMIRTQRRIINDELSVVANHISCVQSPTSLQRR